MTYNRFMGKVLEFRVHDDDGILVYVIPEEHQISPDQIIDEEKLSPEAA